MDVDNSPAIFWVKKSQNKGCEIKRGIFKMKYTIICLHAMGQNIVKRKNNNLRDHIMIARWNPCKCEKELRPRTSGKYFILYMSGYTFSTVTEGKRLESRLSVKLKMFLKQKISKESVCLSVSGCVGSCVCGDGDMGYTWGIGRLRNIWKVWMDELVWKSHFYVRNTNTLGKGGKMISFSCVLIWDLWSWIKATDHLRVFPC